MYSIIYINKITGGGSTLKNLFKGGVSRPCAPVSKPGLLDEGRVPRGVQGRAGARRGAQGRAGARRGVASKTPGKCLFLTV